MGGDKAKAAKELDISLATLYRKLPEEQQDKEKMRQMRLHIEIHRSFIAQEPAGEQQAQQGEEEGPALEGEVIGEEIAAQEGAAQ